MFPIAFFGSLNNGERRSKMNIAIIFAGGTGQRMNSKTLPKQFLELHGKPILIYTMEHFEHHKEIDAVILICVKEWITYCEDLIQRFNFKKLKVIVEGGSNGQESIYHGLQAATANYSPDSVVLIHDGVRPLINENIITDSIACARQNGNAITVSPATETITLCEGQDSRIGRIIDRSCCQMAKAPQCFLLGEIYENHVRARQEGKTEFIDSASLMQHYGHSLYTVVGPAENIKITTPSDFYIFRAMIDARENSQIFGL